MPVPRSRTNRRSRFGRGKVHSKLSIGEKTHIKLEMYPIRHSPQPVFFHYQNYHILSPCLSHYQINYPKLSPCLSHYQINYCNLSPCLSHYQMRYRKLFPCLSHYQNNYCKLSPCLSHSQMRYRIFSHVCPIIKLIIAKIIPMFVPLSVNCRKLSPCLNIFDDIPMKLLLLHMIVELASQLAQRFLARPLGHLRRDPFPTYVANSNHNSADALTITT